VRHHPLANCEACPLFDENSFVPSVGPDKAKLAIVGEAPGYQEKVRGVPFTGPSGRLLDVVLKHAGYKRDEVFLTNACLCRPRDNATPSAEAVRACAPRLLAELKGRDPEAIVPLGNTATQAILNTRQGVTQLRVGPAKQSGTFPGVRVIPTFHPAYCLRQADQFPNLVSDFEKLKEGSREPWSPPDFRVFDDATSALAAIGELQRRVVREGKKSLVIDIEAGIEKDTAFDHPNEYDLLCVGIAYAKGKAIVLGENAVGDRRVLDGLRDLFRSAHLIAHNGKFDLAGLFPHLGALELYFDTMLANYCLDERGGVHGLKYLAVEKLGAPKYDDEVLKYVQGGSYANIPRPLLYRYNAYDVACTWDLYELFEARLASESMRGLHDFLVKASNQLMYLELNGIAIDKDYSDQLMIEYKGVVDEIEDRLNEIVEKTGNSYDPRGAFINPRSPKQVKEFLLDQGVRVDSTNVDTLTVRRRRIPNDTAAARFIDTLLEHRRVQKLYSTYVIGIRKRRYRGRVYTTYLLHGTTSGRLSSRNPNLQNIVRDKRIKKQFAVSKPENLFVHVDYAQAEGRVIATLAQDEYLRGIFCDTSKDIFDQLGMDLYGDKFDHDDKNQRVRIKAYFYGLAYGREAFSIATEHNLPVQEVELGIRAFFGLIPDTAKWQQSIKEHVLAGNDLVTPFGRRRRFYLITEENKKDVLNEALSLLPQSTASDICLSALVRLRPMLRGKAFLRLTIHDALVAECHKDQAEEVGAIMSRVMEEEGARFTDYVPFVTEVSYGKHWGEL
jgi:uracil-DNA glycosylase family 4